MRVEDAWKRWAKEEKRGHYINAGEWVTEVKLRGGKRIKRARKRHREAETTVRVAAQYMAVDKNGWFVSFNLVVIGSFKAFWFEMRRVFVTRRRRNRKPLVSDTSRHNATST